MAGNLFTLLVGLPFQIYVARTLGADVYGAFGLFDTIAQTTAALFGIGLATTVVRFVPHDIELGRTGRARILLRTVYRATTVLGVVAVVLLFVGRGYLNLWLPELRQFSRLFPFVVAMVLLAMLNGLSTQALRAFFDIRGMVFFSSILQLILKVGLAVLLFWWGFRLGGYLSAVVFSGAASLLGMLWVLQRHVGRLPPAREDEGDGEPAHWWSFARVMYFTSLVGIAVPLLERVILAKTIDLSSVGVLMAVLQLQSLPVVLLQVIITVIAPMFVVARARDDVEEARQLFHISVDWIGRVSIPLLVFLIAFGGDILARFGPTFAALGYVPLIILVGAQAVNLLTGPVGAMMNMMGEERMMFRLGMGANVALLLFVLVFASAFGLLGLALARAGSVVGSNLLTLSLARRKLGIRWWSSRYGRLAIPIAACVACGLVSSYEFDLSALWHFVLALVAIYGVFVLTYLMRGLSPEDKEVIESVILRFRRQAAPSAQ